MIPSDLDDLVTHHTEDIGGLNLHWVEAGAGPLTVLLHGFPEMWWSWRHQIRPLAEAGLRVVVPDQRGYNDSGKQGPYDLDTLAADICRLIDRLSDGSKARVVGHDWGGAVAWHLGATRPEHVERLAVLNCPHPAQMRRALFTSGRQARRSWYMAFFQLPLLPEWLLTKDEGRNTLRILKANAVTRDHFGADELEPFRQAALKPGAARGMLQWYRSIPRQLFDRRTLNVEVETLLLWGMRDTALGFDELVPGTERWAQRLKVLPIEDGGHFVQSDRPQAVNAALIDFLAT